MRSGDAGLSLTREDCFYACHDGMVERFNRTLKDQLARFVDCHQRDWDEHILYFMQVYRSAVHSPQFTPWQKSYLGEIYICLLICFWDGQRKTFCTQQRPTQMM